ncbi:major facilitator superfamily domain-containing protein 6 isoform X1 [Frankliniella occidentalis]|uniref:Major facilitator superfamily domain-containing protein 6 isoform X1 n=1 Tax=Frankliniella occidentalis TaxID=133901 RepID=A0A9C6XS30_FRAOC|nr:major facilitator superfamily domain-containing protein 6 isoform X1 [Frankliniella occidentalis]XP_052128998.1 major facilitator superfamily domain-containing protein 6 isoform X1 [Frankliniella occidentalis]XP_052128999.1 major facilitator superfamily domain-containing protein 6 isoform X1 [Frankliniella occidentalis]
MVEVNRKLLPVKAHFFFFMASMGPILPFTIVFGKQLGISEIVMGTVSAVLPLLFLVAKPAFGYLADYFQRQRKLLFMSVICIMCGAHILLYFVPAAPIRPFSVNDITCEEINSCHKKGNYTVREENSMLYNCTWSANTKHIQVERNILTPEKCSIASKVNVSDLCQNNTSNAYDIMCEPVHTDPYLYSTVTFWSFVILMAIGSIGYNVANSISDAICFDVLGEGGEMGYGRQRVFGAIGFGLSALLAGYVIDLFSTDDSMKNYAPAFILTLAFGLLDIFTCTRLKLPKLPKSESILGDVASLLKHRHIVVFLIFATFAGICDSFIIYFMFWYLEDLAMASGAMSHVKLIEGLVIAAETLGGEVIFFSYAGKMIEKLGYEHCLSLSFVFYALRLGLISLANNPWWLLPTEFFLQGPSFALCYTTIVAYASAVAPPGTSATMQGLVAGMDDGFGYAIGSLAGGVLYQWFGGSWSFLMYSGLALACAVAHFALHIFFLKVPSKPTGKKIHFPNWFNKASKLLDNGRLCSHSSRHM